MNIHHEQWYAFQQAGSRRFSERVANFLYREMPDAGPVPRDDMISEVERQIEKAGSYGLTTEIEIVDYVVTAWLLGVNFDLEFPAANSVLTSDISSAEKSSWLSEWTEALFHTLDGDV